MHPESWNDVYICMNKIKWASTDDEESWSVLKQETLGLNKNVYYRKDKSQILRKQH